jgi:DNA-binding transcriptional MerR regulator
LNTTVRTLQYYDKKGVLSPSAESEGGRRLYTDKDIIKLHQILTMKYLGFSLDDIKNRLISLDTPAQVAAALLDQIDTVRNRIASLSEVLQALEKLRAETVQMEMVDFKKYADIVINLQLKNEFYGMIKSFDEKTLDSIRSRFNLESSSAFMNTMNGLIDETVQLQAGGIAPDTEQGQRVVKAWWDLVTAFTGGDTSILPDLLKTAIDKNSMGEAFIKKWSIVEPYIQKGLKVYFINLGTNPFEEAGR